MTDQTSALHTGHCLCGAVRFTARGKLRGVVYCHCSQCRRQSGHYFAATNVQDNKLTIEREDHVKWFAASPDAKRGFCGTCGSSMFWKHNELDYTSITAGVFDQPSALVGEKHIFVADKGDYYEVNDGLPQFAQSSADVKVSGS
jgi:hypothetical protein